MRAWKVASGREDAKEGGEGEAEGLSISVLVVLSFRLICFLQLEQQLLSSLPTWEKKNGWSFLVHGMLQLLMEKASSNEQENRRRTPTSQYSMQALNKGA